VLTQTFRDLASMSDERPKWLVLDGDLDALWVENLNTVMDDNKVLALPSNERIKLTPHMRLIFEVRDVRCASPATVSRAGILFISDTQQWRSLASSWADAFEASEPPEVPPAARRERRAALGSLFDTYIAPALEQLRAHHAHMLPLLDIGLVQTLCALLDALLTPANVGTADAAAFERLFIFAAVWALGGALGTKEGTDHRATFSEWWLRTFTAAPFPPGCSVFDLRVQDGAFVPWTAAVPGHAGLRSTTFLLVPTAECAALGFCLGLLVGGRHAPMLAGPAGCGKSAIASAALRTLPADCVAEEAHAHYYTSAADLRERLLAPLKKVRQYLRPTANFC
jgi:dynein heavy chain